MRQQYGIKFPFSLNNNDNLYLDLNESEFQSIKSKIAHLILTQKGEKIRDPEFGSDLNKYLYEPNDSVTYEKIKEDITNTVKKYINKVTIKEFNITKINENSIKIEVKYIIDEGYDLFLDYLEITIK